MYALINGQIHTGQSILTNHAVIIKQNLIQGICHIDEVSNQIKTVDLNGDMLCAGFIDIQLNGCGGAQFNESLDNLSIETLEIMQKTNEKFGCTSYLPTLITSDDAFIIKAVNVMKLYLQKHQNKALGLHLEGPYINIEKKGIHNTQHIRASDQKMIDFLCENASVIKIITLAPEIVNPNHIKQLANAGICVSIGHSNATYHEAVSGFKSGITMGTHLYNAMSTTSGREPGVVGAIYDDKNVYCGIIADGLHVHYANIRTARKLKGDKLILTTDASLPAGTDIEQCIFGGKTIYHQQGRCFDENNTLAGSALTMIDAIKNSVLHAGISLFDAINMATLYPAKSIGVSHMLGSIEAKKYANLTAFNARYEITKTIINGNILD